MRFQLAVLAATLGALQSAVAFPSLGSKHHSNHPHPSFSAKEKRINGIAPGFDAAFQRIDVSGDHAFLPPGHGDLRGPCPGLNALANHNYLPHDGVATITEFIAATNKVFGMGIDLATFLST